MRFSILMQFRLEADMGRFIASSKQRRFDLSRQNARIAAAGSSQAL